MQNEWLQRTVSKATQKDRKIISILRWIVANPLFIQWNSVSWCNLMLYWSETFFTIFYGTFQMRETLKRFLCYHFVASCKLHYAHMTKSSFAFIAPRKSGSLRHSSSVPTFWCWKSLSSNSSWLPIALRNLRYGVNNAHHHVALCFDCFFFQIERTNVNEPRK